MIHAAVVNRYAQRDMRLIAEASDIIANMGPRAGNTHMGLSTQLELETILCTEHRYIQPPRPHYNLRTNPFCRRNSYFSVINLIGGPIFRFVGDHHCQRDGVLKAEAARMDNMIERIRNTAN